MSKHKYHFLEWNRKIYTDGKLYLQRWFLDFYFFSIRLHCFHRSDDDRALHDHPWWFATLILSTGYWDITELGVEWCPPFSFRFRKFGHKHRVEIPDDKKVWTLVVTGKYKHDWGFYLKDGFISNKEYFNQSH